eukprot:CAMPEP_0168513440 /NCGR_PEP_ID=MMETSP0405-20121227/3459_1 /TAXON_ID=498012 /ORGANISM="Trichosphaerium sp, Strain Am-I-7 wt" /LENGTH=238 /DNA_ID=CAMNT_0008532263 /DNA_START=98 /DNA_END=814 /DNA_ORIENTATION=+
MSWQKVDGLLVHISVGPNGTTWGVNTKDEIYHRPELNAAGWTKVDGLLKQVSVGANGHVWGCNAKDEIYFRNGASTENPLGHGWQKVDGGLKYVSVGADGRVWGCNAKDEIYYRNGLQGKWQKIDGLLKNLTVMHNNSVIGTNKNDDLYIREGVTADKPTGTSWKKLDKSFSHMSASNHGFFGVQKDSDIYWKPLGKGSWSKISGGLKQIDIGCQGHVWGVNKKDEIYYLKSGVHLSN